METVYVVILMSNGDCIPTAFSLMSDALKAYEHHKSCHETVCETVEENGDRYFTTDIPGEFVMLKEAELF